MLKSHLQQAEDKAAKKAVGANGMANGGTGGKGSKCVISFCLAVTVLMHDDKGRGTTMTRIQR